MKIYVEMYQPTIQLHTGIFHGVLDRIVPFQSALQLHKGIAGSVLFPFEQSGHGVFYDELDRFNHSFLQFLLENKVAVR
jgi:non-heme chloroperoxidase